MTVEEVDTKDVIKVGVIGMGRIGLVHLEAITKAPGVTPVIVSNPTVSKAEAGTYLLFHVTTDSQVIVKIPPTVTPSIRGSNPALLRCPIFNCSCQAVQHPQVHGRRHGCYH